MRADPDVLVRRRDRERADALQLGRLANALAVGADVGEAVADANATDAGRLVAHPDQAARRCRRRRRPAVRAGCRALATRWPSRSPPRSSSSGDGRRRVLAAARAPAPDRPAPLRVVDRRRHALRVLRRRRQRRRRNRLGRRGIVGWHDKDLAGRRDSGQASCRSPATACRRGRAHCLDGAAFIDRRRRPARRHAFIAAPRPLDRSATSSATKYWRTRLSRLLRGTFGLKHLREGQAAVIEHVMAGAPTLAVMPTGAGKSLCYQLPALAPARARRSSSRR